MVKDPSAPGTTPLAFLCKDISFFNFNKKHLSVYKYLIQNSPAVKKVCSLKKAMLKKM